MPIECTEVKTKEALVLYLAENPEEAVYVSIGDGYFRLGYNEGVYLIKTFGGMRPIHKAWTFEMAGESVYIDTNLP